MRPKETYDGAIPSGNSLMAYNLVRLSFITDEDKYRECARSQLDFLQKTAAKYPDLTLDGGRDPHIWLCPERASFMVNLIAEELAVLSPENAQKYNQNAQNYINEISSATKTAQNILETGGIRDFFVFHPSFQYFANYFSLNMYALEEHGKEATPKHLAQMVDLAKEKNIEVVFYQAEASSRQAESFAKEIGAKAVKLEPLSADYTKNIIKMATAIAGE